MLSTINSTVSHSKRNNVIYPSLYLSRMYLSDQILNNEGSAGGTLSLGTHSPTINNIDYKTYGASLNFLGLLTDGSQNCIYTNSFSTGSGYTFSFWLKGLSTINFSYVINVTPAGNINSLSLFYSGTSLIFRSRVNSSNTAITIFTSDTINDSTTWNHIVITHIPTGVGTDGNLYYYINGVGKQIFLKFPAIINETIKIGTIANYMFKGYIDDFRYYNSPLAITDLPAIWFSQMNTNVSGDGNTLYNEGYLNGNGTLLMNSTVNSTSYKTYTKDLSFNATQNTIISFPIFQPDANGYSICFWFKSTTTIQKGIISISVGNTTNFTEIDFGYSGDTRNTNYIRLISCVNSTQNNCYYNNGSSLCDGTWKHATFTHSYYDTQCIFYLNGVSKTVSTNTLPYPNYINYQYTNASIGTETTTVQLYKGELDDIRFYNRIISSDEIAYINSLSYKSTRINDIYNFSG